MSILKLIEKIIGDPQKKELRRIGKIVEKINEIELGYQSELKDEEVPQKTAEFKKRLQEGEKLADLLPEAFALVKTSCRRLVGKTWPVRGFDYTWDMVPFDVQLIGGIALHEGKIAEMKTGEGKTLVCTLPVYLNALEGKGVHVVTVNDYLANRDAEWMGGLYHFLGLTVGVNIHGLNRAEKNAAYKADVTYGTNNEFGFDYLRDNMAPELSALVQRELNFAIVDEVDSILVDEARTPLIISAPAEESTEKYMRYSGLVQQLKENDHYNVDEKLRVATLTEDGVKQMEQWLGVDNIYTEKGFEEVHHIEQALRAHAVYKSDVDYVVKDDQVLIVDEFTGRLMPGRRFSQGLHQAIEAKEKVSIRKESRTLATITLQNYFRMYKKLAGMTGTAKTEEEEFRTIYGLDVLEIPTHRSVVRQDQSDVIYKSMQGKFQAIAQKVRELHEKGQPALIGTISVEKSEALSKLLQAEHIPHNVLNAKFHEKEAEIIAKAGQKGAVTIATNMAGRGTDIKLGPEVKELGGLVVMGSERHEARRIDNQLRGRSGRQGDPGFTQFYVSLEDDLMRIFGGSRMQSLMDRLGLPEDMPIETRMISRSLESAQKKVEGHNFDIRRHLVQYDDVMNTHRDILYKRRRGILENENLKNDVLVLIEQEAEKIVLEQGNDIKELFETVFALHRDAVTPLSFESIDAVQTPEERMDLVKKYLISEYEEKEKALPSPEILRKGERLILLRVLDTHWMRHLDELRELREAVALSGYGQKNPLIEYKNQAYVLFEELMARIDRNTVAALFHVKINVRAVQPAAQPAAPSPTAGTVRTNEDQIEENLEEPSLEGRGAQGPSASETLAALRTEQAATKKTGRNDPCPCGSGKKYKHCHGK